MKRITIGLLIFISLCTATAFGDTAATFEQGKAWSADSGKPLLMEFVREDCSFCSKAAEDAASEEAVMHALDTVVHLPVDVFTEEGKVLKERYQVGSSYPVFILADSTGEVITRWTGYTSSTAFVNSLGRAMRDLTTVKERVAEFDRDPDHKKAIALGEFFTDSGDYLLAAKFYRTAQELAPNDSFDFSYKIFTNTANSVWNELAAYETIFPAAEAVLKKGPGDVANMAVIMSRLSRKFGRPDSLGKYLKAGMEAAQKSSVKALHDKYDLLRAEEALQLKHDTSRAISIEKSSLGKEWELNPDKFYAYAEWCLERKVALEEASQCALKAAKMANPGSFKARILNTLAEISYARGKKEEAVGIIKLAIKEQPENPYYADQLRKFQEPEPED